MAFTPTTVGEAIGLQGQVKDYTNQIIGAQKLRRQEDALKRKEEEEEFAKLADIKIDYSKYHRLDRPRVKQMYTSYLNEMNKLYKEGNPNWKNVAYEKGNDLKFAIEQVAVDSKVKFDTEKYVTDPTTKKSQELMDYYNWLNQGDFNNPPKIQPDAYGQITAFDPTTGTIGFVSGKNYNLPKLAEESVFNPALVGYVTDPNSVTFLADGYKNVTQRAEYNPVMIEGAIANLAGTQDFNGWRIDNAERIRKYAAANPSLPPQDVMYNLWAEDIMKQEPTKTKEYRLSPKQDFNINLGGETETEPMAGYGKKTIYVGGFHTPKPDKSGKKPMEYTSQYEEGGKTIRPTVETVDGYTVPVQTVRIASGPYLKSTESLEDVDLGTVEFTFGDMALVPVYKSGTSIMMNNKPVDVGGRIISSEDMEVAKNTGKLTYEVVAFGSGDYSSLYGRADAMINNALQLKEDKGDKKVLQKSYNILVKKRDELNKGLGGKTTTTSKNEPTQTKKKLTGF